MIENDVRQAIVEHVDAFNAHDTHRVMAGLSTDAVWTTGADTVRGTAGLIDVFDPWLWSLQPSLEVLALVVDGSGAAAELRERLTVSGVDQVFDIGGFFTVVDGLITRAKIYREGRADVDDPSDRPGPA